MNKLKSSSVNCETNYNALQIEQCNVKLNVEYEQNELHFKWDLTDVSISNSYFTRHILIFDLEGNQMQRSEQRLIKKFYKYMKLGDFFRVCNTKGIISTGWIQKTSQQIKLNEFQIVKQQKRNLMNILQRSFKKKIEFNEPLTISIFSNQKVVFAAQSIEEMSRKKIKYKFNFILNIFFFLEKQNEIILPQFHKLFNIYSYTNLQNINTQFTDFFYNLNKIRVQTASLKLICFNKAIQLCDVANSQWQIQQDSLVRNLYMLNNHTKYIQKLYFNSLNNQKIYFEVQFQLNFIQNKKYKMTKKFCVNIQKNCSNLTKISQTHHYRKLYNRKLFSQMVKQNGLINQINSERILIRQKFPQLSLEYQKQMMIQK